MDASTTETNLSQQSSAEETARTRKTTLLAWSFWVLVMLSALVSFVLRTWNTAALIHLVQGAQYLQELLNWAILTPLTAPAFGTVGAIIASRRPKNRVGWLCLALGLVVALQDAAWQYGARALEVAPGSLAAGSLLAMLGSILGILQAPLPYILLLLVFPDGKFLSPRWRLLAWAAILLCVLGVFTTIIYPTISAGLATTVHNPLGIKSLQPFDDLILLVGFWALNLFSLLAVFSIIVRWRRAGETERQQLKWLVYIGVITVGTTIFGNAGTLLPVSPYIPVLIGAIGVAGASIGIPVTIGIAILKRRLYDIDILINRTLVYGTLTLLLGLVYFGLIFTLQYLLQGMLTQKNGLAIVASTLVIAALFQPLRHHTQTIIDRRFYRRKYDVSKTLATFSATLRNEVDLNQLNEQLIAVVEETMQPAHVSLWLCPPTIKRLPTNTLQFDEVRPSLTGNR